MCRLPLLLGGACWREHEVHAAGRTLRKEGGGRDRGRDGGGEGGGEGGGRYAYGVRVELYPEQQPRRLVQACPPAHPLIARPGTFARPLELPRPAWRHRTAMPVSPHPAAPHPSPPVGQGTHRAGRAAGAAPASAGRPPPAPPPAAQQSRSPSRPAAASVQYVS
jgi:hypothetical protein